MVDEYYPDSKKQLEAAIPIIIIILLIIGLILWKPELFAGIPVIGDWFAPKAVNVLIIGDQATEKDAWVSILSSDIARNVFGNTLNVDVVTPAGGTYTYADINDPAWLDTHKVKVVVLTGTHLTDSLQLTLRKWVENGGNLLVIGIGGTQENGRWAELTNVLPVSCGIEGDCTTVIKSVFAPKLYIEDYTNPLKDYIDDKTPLTEANESMTIADVSMVNEGKEIVYIGGFSSASEVTAGEVGSVYPGILERDFGVKGGKVVYISFNPTTENITPSVEKNLVINLIAYTIGVEGYKSA